MSLSRGSRSLILDIAGWAVGLGIAAVGIMHSSDLKAIGYRMIGMQQPGLSAATATTAGVPRGEQPRATSPKVELRASSNGHFFAPAEVNGRRIETMIDTGASIIALTFEDAQSIGVAPSARDFTHQVSTANGVSRVAPVVLDRVLIGDIMVRNVQAVVAERGKLNITLLGNSFLSRVSYRMSGGRMIIED